MSHNTNDPRHPWARLVAAAREVGDDRSTSAPYGFSTRVAALALAQENRVSAMLEVFALRAVGLAALLALGSVALNFQALTEGAPVASQGQPVEEFEAVLPTDDAVAIVLDLAD